MRFYSNVLIFELHDDKTGHETQGTFVEHIGRWGSIRYAHQGEMQLQDSLDCDPTWRRAYLKAGDQILAIWTRDLATGELRYLARHPIYDGEWELPFVDSPAATIAVGIWGLEVETVEEVLDWARRQLETSITAILLDDGEIYLAWELVDGEPELISCGPSSTR